MMVAERHLTPWFNGFPFHTGEYQARYSHSDNSPHMRLWDGSVWRFPVQKNKCATQNVLWRGMNTQQPDDEMWVQANGVAIAVGEMDEQHVRNALRMVLRRKRLTDVWPTITIVSTPGGKNSEFEQIIRRVARLDKQERMY